MRVHLCVLVPTHVYNTRTGPGHGLRTPYRTGCTARVNTGACLLHFACVRAVRCSAWIVRAVVYLDVCMCVCTAVGMCSSTCIFCTAFCMSTRADVPSLPYLLRSSLGYHGRCTYSPVLVPRAGTSFVQCFAWLAKRGQMCLVYPTPCAVRLGITGAEHTRPCWYLCWYLFQRGQMCLVYPTPCAVRLGITGAEHTRPCWTRSTIEGGGDVTIMSPF